MKFDNTITLNKSKLIEGGVYLKLDENTSDHKLYIPKDFVRSVRIDSKMTMTVGDVIHEILKVVYNFQTLSQWNEYVSNRMGIDSCATLKHYVYILPESLHSNISL